MSFLSFIRSLKKNKSTSNSVKEIKELNNKINEIEKLVKQLDERKVEYNITIEQLDLHDPILENLTFRLDNLDIKDLSGALNLGNNLGVNVHQNEKKEEVRGTLKKMKRTQGKAKDAQTIMSKKKTGYSFKFNSQEKKEK